MEFREMWVVEASLKIKPIMAFYDEEKKRVLSYAFKNEYDEENSSRNEWYCPYPNETYHLTEGAAIDYRNSKRKELKEMIPKVRDFIERMDDIESTEEFSFSREDYLGCYAKKDRSYYQDEYYRVRKKCYIYKYAILCGTLNINAETFKIDDIERIEWNKVTYHKDGKSCLKDGATIFLKSGKAIKTFGQLEYEIIEELFGENKSGRIFNTNGSIDDLEED